MDCDQPDITLRAAQPGEAAIITGHRLAMFAEMRSLPQEQLDAIGAAFEPWVEARLARGDYHGWFAVNAVGEVVGGAGVWMMDWPPHIVHVEPRRAYILNVYVSPSYRRRGLGRALTQSALDWCRQQRVRLVVLHASEAGRPIYQALGFKATNEMSLVLDLEPARASTP